MAAEEKINDGCLYCSVSLKLVTVQYCAIIVIDFEL